MWQSLQKIIFILDNPQLEYSVLNPNGPFVRLNPFNKLCSGETQTLVLSFSPHENMLVSAAPRQCCCPGIPTLQDHGVTTGVGGQIPLCSEAQMINWSLKAAYAPDPNSCQQVCEGKVLQAISVYDAPSQLLMSGAPLFALC